MRHGTFACRSAGCECADCLATESVDRMEAREAEKSWWGKVKPRRDKLLKSAARNRYVIHVPGKGDCLYTLPGRGKPGKLEEIGCACLIRHGRGTPQPPGTSPIRGSPRYAGGAATARRAT